MNYRLAFTLMSLIAILAVGPALGSEPFCVTFQGIAGPGVDPECGPESSLGLEYHHLMAREVTHGIPGPLEHHQVIITKQWDQADPSLWQRLDSGGVVPEVILEFNSAGIGGRPYFMIRLTNVHVLAIEPLIPHVGNPDSAGYGDQSRIRLDYQTISIEFQGQDPVVLQADAQH